MSIRTLAAAVAALVVSGTASATVIIGSPNQVYTQDFDTLTLSTTSSAWTNDSTLVGWSLFAQPAPGSPIASYAATNGGSNAGGFFSMGTTGSSDRALGGVGSGGTYFGSPASGAVAGWIAVGLTNASGFDLAGFSVAFDGEQWRNGGNTSAQTMVLEYGFGAAFGSVSSWTAPGGLFDWASVVNTATAAAVDGNVTGLVAGRGGAVAATWAAGETLWLRWLERNDTGNDHGLAIDNFSLTAGATVVPLPGALGLLVAGLGGLGWFGRGLRRQA